jgi:Flp pilus assembly pilin Flp
MSEYALVIFIVAIATVATMTLFSDNLRTVFAASASALTGEGDAQSGGGGGGGLEGSNPPSAQRGRRTLPAFQPDLPEDPEPRDIPVANGIKK